MDGLVLEKSCRSGSSRLFGLMIRVIRATSNCLFAVAPGAMGHSMPSWPYSMISQLRDVGLSNIHYSNNMRDNNLKLGREQR